MKGAVGRAVGKGQRIKTGRLARRDPAVATANAANKDFRAPVLVEQDGAWLKPLGLSGKKVHDHGLAGTGRANDRKVTQIAIMEIKEKGRRAGGLKDRHRITPMVALGLAQGKPVERAKAGHIAR